MKIECALYLTLGAALCVLAVLIHVAPVICTWAALVTYAAAWIIDLLLIEAFFGSFIAGLAVFSLGTVVKIGIISGLWYGVRVGHEYHDQVLKPLRELREDD
jgi:hypothetical protein